MSTRRRSYFLGRIYIFIYIGGVSKHSQRRLTHYKTNSSRWCVVLETNNMRNSFIEIIKRVAKGLFADFSVKRMYLLDYSILYPNIRLISSLYNQLLQSVVVNEM